MAAHGWWRLVIVANQGDGRCVLGRVEMRSAPGGDDLCFGGEAFASSASEDWGPDRCFDGASDTMGWMSVGGLPQWIAYRFAQPVDVAEVVWWFPASADGGVRSEQSPRDFRIEASDDGDAWILLREGLRHASMGYGEARAVSLAPLRGLLRSEPVCCLGAIVGPPSMRVLHHGPRGLPAARAADFWGLGRVEGKVTVEGAQAARRVRLLDTRTGLLVAETWSGRDGAYRFEFVDPERDYVLLAHDHLGQFNAVVADAVHAELASYP